MTMTWDGALFVQSDVREQEVSQNTIPNYIVSAIQPTNPVNGTLWFNTTNAVLYIYSGTV